MVCLMIVANPGCASSLPAKTTARRLLQIMTREYTPNPRYMQGAKGRAYCNPCVNQGTSYLSNNIFRLSTKGPAVSRYKYTPLARPLPSPPEADPCLPAGRRPPAEKLTS